MEEHNNTEFGMPVKEVEAVTYKRTQTYLDLTDNVVKVNVYFTAEGEQLSDFIKQFAEETNRMIILSEDVEAVKI